MSQEPNHAVAVMRLRQARNVFLTSQVAALDLAKISSSEAARLDFPENRAKRLCDWLGRSDLRVDDAMRVYNAVSSLVEIAEAQRSARGQDGGSSAAGSTGAERPTEKTRDDSVGPDVDTSAEHPSDEVADTEVDPRPADASIEASRAIDAVFNELVLPEHASFRAIAYVIKMRSEKSRSALMLESLLLSAVAQFEVFISRVVLVSLRLDPSPLMESDKTYAYRDVVEYSSLDAFYKSAADGFVDALMYKGMDSWMKFLTRATRSNMDWVTDLLAEVIMRRNVHVHAGGKASAQYLSMLGKKAAAVRIGDDLPVTGEYLEDALNRMARAAVVLSQAGVAAICAAAQGHGGQPIRDQDQGVVDASFDLLVAGRYSAVEHLFVQLESLVAKNSTRERLRANAFAARKHLYGKDEVRRDIENWDVSAAEDELVLAKYCLLDDIEAARVMFDQLQGAGKISVMELATWPILEPLREAMVAGDSPEPEAKPGGGGGPVVDDPSGE